MKHSWRFAFSLNPSLAIIIVLVGPFIDSSFSETPTSWSPELSLQVKTVEATVPSPDGLWVAYTQNRWIVEKEESDEVSHIFLARSDGSRRFQLTRGEKSAWSPSFSPDGHFVYFVSSRSGDMNIWRIAMDGGEAERLTDWRGSLGAYLVSPDGKWVAFTGRKLDLEEENAKKEKRDFRVLDEESTNHALWMIPAEMDSKRKRPVKRLSKASYHVQEFVWSPDSRKIAFEHRERASADKRFRKDLSEVTLEGGSVRQLAATRRDEAAPRYSPNGRYLAYLRSSDPPRWAQDGRIVLLPLAGGELLELAPMQDDGGRRTNLLGWSADSQRLYFTEVNGVQEVLRAMPLDGPPKTVYQPSVGTLNGRNTRLNSARTHVAFVEESSDHPPEAYVLDLLGGAPSRVSDANVDLPLPPLGETKVVNWNSKDGREIEGLLTYPVGYQPGKRYPLVLFIHGGPMEVFTNTFIGGGATWFHRLLFPAAVFAARGYAVLSPNPRGSTGYGREFRFANFNDWGGGDYQDLMSGVDHVISMGVADAERLAAMGWSGGGYLTAWVVTQTHRFKAAVVGAGITNLWSMAGTTDASNYLPEYFSGEPWEKFAAYRDRSPMTFVKGVTTPTLILHGEYDRRVPVSQAYEFYNALRRLGVTTRMVVYPRSGHGVGEPKFALDVAKREVAWVEKYVK